MAAARPEPQPTTTATVEIPIQDGMTTCRASGLGGLVETVFTDSLRCGCAPCWPGRARLPECFASLARCPDTSCLSC